MKDKTIIRQDAKLIEALGGPVKLAAILGYKGQGGIQVCRNWKTRGIPADVKLANLKLFGVIGQRKAGRAKA